VQKTLNQRYGHLLGTSPLTDILDNKVVETSAMFEVGGSVQGKGVNPSDGKRGGYFKGRSHREGGIKAYNVTTGQPIEVEGDEVIITKPAVLDETKREFEGEMLTNKEILSRINEGGGGVKFEDGGEIERCACGGKTYKYGGEVLEDSIIISRLERDYQEREISRAYKQFLSKIR